MSTQPKYLLQGGIHRRTESAILEGTKNLIALHGISNISMIEIADASEVSRATLYNHYRDKNAVLNALITAEVERLVELASRAGTPADALETLSIEISHDAALASMRIHDQDALIAVMTHAENPLYLVLATCIYEATKSEAGTGLAMRWLLGQVMQPISAKQSREQAELLVDRTLF
ncbi:MAG: TetR/AcrR family transcriptional regulator [Actinobacteria bacterium]|nr:TetR/AcrR family transcriptional regulator [Actinomycetota bacterium]